MTAIDPGSDLGVRVQPLPWPVVELFSASLRKLAHDLTNSLVAAVSLVDLTLMKSNEPAARNGLNRLRNQILRPRTTLQCATAALPGMTADRPRTVQALEVWAKHAATAQELVLAWQLDGNDQPPRGLTEPEWVHVVQALCQNALEAHAAARIDKELQSEPESAWLRIESARARDGSAVLTVRDNAMGCADLQAAATGRLRRAGGGHLGLGLSIAAALVERAGGQVLLASEPPHGFRATVTLPRTR